MVGASADEHGLGGVEGDGEGVEGSGPGLDAVTLDLREVALVDARGGGELLLGEAEFLSASADPLSDGFAFAAFDEGVLAGHG